MNVIVPSFTWHHHGRTPIMWRVFSRGGRRRFWCFWQFCFYTRCRGSYISLFLCYCYFCSQFSIICLVNMAAVIERLFLVGASETFSDTTSLWVSEGLPGVIKIAFFHVSWATFQYTWTPCRSFWWLFYSFVHIV